MKFPFIAQSTFNDCGPACLGMMAAYYDRHYDLEFLKKKCRIKKAGVSMLDIYRTAKALGFRCRGVRIGIEKLTEVVFEAPAILYCKKHFIILYKVRRGTYHVADPAKGLVSVKKDKLLRYWVPGKFKTKGSAMKQGEVGHALLIKPMIFQKNQMARSGPPVQPAHLSLRRLNGSPKPKQRV